jgi:hypothetical protein
MRSRPPWIRPLLEPLEDRILLSAPSGPPLPEIQMTGATTTNSRTISIDYNILDASITGQPLAFDVYRTAAYDSLAGAQFLGTATLPASDAADLSEGSHQGVQLALANAAGQPVTALTPNTALPYIVVVANPTGSVPESNQPNNANNLASFETHVLGVVVHGLEFNLKGKTPGWETRMAAALQQEDGYQAALAFNWVQTSWLPLPGLAVQAGDSLEQQVVAEANQLAAQHPGDVVDVNFIGHSRGTVVISRALQDLVGTTDPALAGGYLEMTLLDPHPANNLFGPFSFLPSSKLSHTAALGVVVFQALAQDPQVVVPPDVMQTQLFYQNTPAGNPFHNLTETYVNLWGDGPGQVVNQSGQPIESKNLTGVNAPAFGLVGHDGVHRWYLQNVVDANQTFNYFG